MVQLALIGALHEASVDDTPQAVDRLILGLAGQAEVTLAGCWLRSNPWNTPGWLEETWVPQVVLRGAWLDDPADLVFDSVYFEVDALLEWTNRAHIDRDYRDDDAHRIASVVIQHDAVPPESIELEDGGTLEIRFPWATEGDGVRHSTIRQGCVIHRTWAGALPLDEVLAEVRLFQHLLTIAVNQACSYRSITLQHPEVVMERNDRIYREPIEFSAPTKSPSLPVAPHPVNMLFRFEDLGGIEGLRRWRDVATKYARALDMATSVRYLPGMFGENKVANTTSAAEALHRLLFPGKAIDDETYDALRTDMLKVVADGKHRQHLGHQLRHANEHFLSARLRQLANYASPAAETVVGDARRWARLVATVRNGLTHPENVGADDGPKANGRDLLLLSESVYLVVALCMLRETGLSEGALLSAVQRMSVQWATRQIPDVIERLWPLVEARR